MVILLVSRQLGVEECNGKRGAMVSDDGQCRAGGVEARGDGI